MRKAVSIRRSLMTNLAVVVLTLGVAIVVMMALSTRRIIQTMSESLIHQTSRRTELKLRTFFEPVSNQIDSLRGWGESGELDIDAVERLPYILRELLEEFPHSSAVYLADESDREIFLTRQGSNWMRRDLDVDERGGVAAITEWTDGDPTPRQREEIIDHRPTQRPWFQGAVAMLEASSDPNQEDVVYWTDPYLFFSTGTPGISASAAFRSAAGRLQVVGMDVTLAEISRFTSNLQILGDAKVFVLTDDRRLIGIPRQTDGRLSDDEIEQLLLKTPDELGTSTARGASQHLLDSESQWNQAVRIATDRDPPWWGQITPYQLSPTQRLLIGVGIPERDLVAGIERQRLWVIAITIVVLGLAVLRVLDLARRYSRPIEELVEETHRISTGDLEPRPPIKTRVAEVRQLAEAHDKMRGGLRTLMKLERELQLARDIQRRTFPEQLPQLDGFDIAAWNEPADETGGDSYDVIGLIDSVDGGRPTVTQERADRAILLLADATGHGVGPALSVTQLRAMLRMAVRLGPDTRGLIEEINQQLYADLPRERFITAWMGLIDARDHTLTAFSAAQAPLLHYRARHDSFDELGSNSVALGMFPKINVEVPDPVSMEPGDIYAVISDGIFEACAPDGREMETARVADVISRHRDLPAAEIIDKIRVATLEFTANAPADDDRTIVLIRRT